ncbi:hypothetical protein L208DRAFT_11569 [Tricholoma matsutake]|nr:hypothetical protein L208DRAFT_11569 [Tricholoma matsutake 945]
MQLAVLEVDGYAVCPDCGTRVKCGSAGLNNLEKCHRASDACKNAREKCDKDMRKKNANLFNYFKGPKHHNRAIQAKTGPEKTRTQYLERMPLWRGGRFFEVAVKCNY